MGGPGRSTEWQPNTDPGKHGTLLRAARARRSEKKGEKGRDNLHFYSKPEDFFAFFAPFSRGLCAKNHAGKYGLKGLFLILSPPLPHSTKLTDSAHVRGVARRSKSINSNMTSSGIIICIVDNKWDGAKTIFLTPLPCHWVANQATDLLRVALLVISRKKGWISSKFEKTKDLFWLIMSSPTRNKPPGNSGSKGVFTI